MRYIEIIHMTVSCYKPIYWCTGLRNTGFNCHFWLQWTGYIKDYDGGTLMESIIYPELPYTTMPQMILAQKAELDRRIRKLSTASNLYPGLQHFQQKDAGPLEVSDIPGVFPLFFGNVCLTSAILDKAYAGSRSSWLAFSTACLPAAGRPGRTLM